jgi:hypothetical protein
MLAMSLTVSAQNQGFAFGIKLGPNFGWTGSTTAQSLGSRTGFDVGVVGEYYFADNYAIVSGVNVSFLGGHYLFDNAHIVTDSLNPDGFLEMYGVDRTFKSTVYEIPLMLKMVTNEFGDIPLRAYFEVGGGIGLAAKKVMVKDAIPSENIAAPEKWGVTNKEFSNLRASLKIGAGAQYTVDESTRLFAGVYFSHDILNNINSISPNYYKFHNGDKNLGEREKKLNMLQNRIGIEVGVLF